ncbi:CD44 antigen isoform X2 [Protopterus annectens]|uniref:CD44 antigen isoform X2 n=1 Tax=Protopterus annectens TaxID=7888 RepID=UPI001CFA205B|nr:CD44 antigen isoform X2 [Protopterus annectens]
MRRIRLLFLLTWVFCSLGITLAEPELNVSCRFYGVFHVEKYGRYALSRDEGKYVCESFGTALATLAQLEKAYTAGFQTCRYGWIEGHVAIVRQESHFNCAANATGVILLNSTHFSDKYDVYCFNGSDDQEKVCDPLRHSLRLPTMIPTTVISSTLDDKGPVKEDTAVNETVTYSTVSPEESDPHHGNEDNVDDTPTTLLPSDENATSYGTPFPVMPPEGDELDDSKKQSTTTASSSTQDDSGNQGSSTWHSEFLDKWSSSTTVSDSDSDNGDRSPVISAGTENGTVDGNSKNVKSGRNILWLIILLALLIVLIVTTICIMVANRKRLCGKKKKLVITSTKEKPKKEPKKDKKQEVNGDTKKSEETVQLMNAEANDCHSKTADECVAVNVSDVDEPSADDMKSSV